MKYCIDFLNEDVVVLSMDLSNTQPTRQKIVQMLDEVLKDHEDKKISGKIVVTVEI